MPVEVQLFKETANDALKQIVKAKIYLPNICLRKAMKNHKDKKKQISDCFSLKKEFKNFIFLSVPRVSLLIISYSPESLNLNI